MRSFRLRVVTFLLLVVIPLGALVTLAAGSRQIAAAARQPQPKGPVATVEQLEKAREEWSLTKHADTYDNGLGANTTCARCKSPLDWDPSQDLAQQQALDCVACKRIPGAPRPELEAGVPVSESEWKDISCEICHEPVGDSYRTSISYWNQEIGEYEPVDGVMDLCAKCHEGRHGFHVVEEQAESQAHHGWDCTICHGAHSSRSECTDCHIPNACLVLGYGDFFPAIRCTGCHDDGGLTIWQDTEANSAHEGTFITRRFAHNLTSWPSHNLSSDIDCTQCHHPIGNRMVSIVPSVSCEACHEDGAVLFWCEYFPRDPAP